MKHILILTLLLLSLATSAFAGERYVLTLGLKQSRISLNIFAHAKDAWNATEFQIPVDKEFFNSVKDGDVLTEKFRTGSLVLNGSFSDWKVWVKKKQIVRN